MMPSSSSCTSHARFLRILVEREQLRTRQMSGERMNNIDPALQTPVAYSPFDSNGGTPTGQLTANRNLGTVDSSYTYHAYQQPESLVSPPNGKDTSGVPNGDSYHGAFPNQTRADHIYYDNMCRELGVTQGVDLIGPPSFYPRMATSEPYTMMG